MFLTKLLFRTIFSAFFLLFISSVNATNKNEANTYGPIASGEHIYRIAIKLRPNNEITIQQVMLALYEANPTAFYSGNINCLKIGSMLKIPPLTIKKINEIPSNRAYEEVRQHNQVLKSTHSEINQQNITTSLPVIASTLERRVVDLHPPVINSCHLPCQPLIYNLHSRPDFFRFSGNIIHTQHGEKLALLGASYLVHLNPWFYGGLSSYGTLKETDNCSFKLFSLGLTGGIEHRLLGNFWGDIGAYAGGSRGGGTKGDIYVGDGLMVRPNVSLGFRTNNFKIGLQYSYLTFPNNGHFHENQLGLVLDIPSHILFANPCYGFNKIPCLDSLRMACGQLGFQKKYLGINLQRFHTRDKHDHDALGKRKEYDLDMIGAEAGYYFTQHGFVFLRAAGSYSGNDGSRGRGSLFSILAGSGYSFPINHKISLVPKLVAGAVSGGGIRLGYGFVVGPELGLQFNINPELALQLGGNYLISMNGDFHAVSVVAQLNYMLDSAVIVNSCHNIQFFNPDCYAYEFHNWRVGVVNQTIVNVERFNRHNKTNINMINLKLDQILNPYTYLTYQGAVSYEGDITGGFGKGMIGLGLQSRFKRLQVHAEALVGYGITRGIDLGSGLLLEPKVGITFNVTNYVGLNLAAGRIIAPDGDLNSTVVDAGLVINFASLMRHCHSGF